MATIAACTSENVDFCLTCAPTVEAVYLRCGFARTPPLDPQSSEQCVPERDPKEMALAKAALRAHLSRAGGDARCCPDRALPCKVCELNNLITAEAATLLMLQNEGAAGVKRARRRAAVRCSRRENVVAALRC